MKILFLISQLPYPTDTGAKIRSFNLIKNLSLKHEICLIAYGSQNEKEKIEALKQHCVKLILVDKPSQRMYLKAILNLFIRAPFNIHKYYSRRMQDKVEELISSGEFDILHCDSLQMSLNVIKLNKRLPMLLTEHNIESQILKRAAENEKNPIKKFYFYIQYMKLQSYEAFACKRFNRVVAVSKNDKEFLSKFIPYEQISIVSNGVDTCFFSPEVSECRDRDLKKRLVFTGSMDWLPNDDAMLYFIKHIYPLIKRKISDIEFVIVGRNPSGQLLSAVKNDNSIRILGKVEDMRPFIAQADIFVVPLRIGGGTRLKILEAMAMGKPVISTTIGAEGLEVESEKNIVLADKPEDFANKVVKLFNDYQFKNSIATAGRKLVEEKYDWDMITGELERVWEITG